MTLLLISLLRLRLPPYSALIFPAPSRQYQVKGELKDEEHVSKAQLGAFFAAITIRANIFPEATQWSEGERRAMETYWPHLVRNLPSDIIFLANPEGSIMRLGSSIGPQYFGNGTHEMRLVGALREVLAGGYLRYEEVQGVLKDVLPLMEHDTRLEVHFLLLLFELVIMKHPFSMVLIGCYPRRQESSIGFGAPVRANMRNSPLTNAVVTSSLLEFVESSDLIAYGLIPKFIGRFPILVSLSALTEDQLVQNALGKQYKKLFQMNDVKLHFTDKAQRLIAQKEMAKNTGARGLRAILETLLTDSMYENQIPDVKTGNDRVDAVVIDEETVDSVDSSGCGGKILRGDHALENYLAKTRSKEQMFGGPENVAEITGRRGVLVSASSGKGVTYQARNT
ncbi:hypothetical protein L2E82_01002 [Cichorium intybus]|uniref:Uncharacterized protein n=1 Tax=Cichorium intybus TaxID=13427 RepID=A0ACB9GXR0_CICIN|nr:hypothetical protein L2E82_01002 [Cichorium intybus]